MENVKSNENLDACSEHFYGYYKEAEEAGHMFIRENEVEKIYQCKYCGTYFYTPRY